ncbi:MAG: hypothetical protein AAFZ15_05515 [Bacteroidota bacterium]
MSTKQLPFKSRFIVFLLWGISSIAYSQTTGYATAVTSQNGISNASNALNAADGSYAQVYDLSDYLILDLGITLPAGSTYEITWRRKSSYGDGASAEITLRESSNNSSYTTNPFNPSTTSKSSFVTTTVTANVATRYIRFAELTGTGDDFDLDAVTYTVPAEDCNNGLDDDYDGLVDCDDPDCVPSGNADTYVSQSGVTNPGNALGAPNGSQAQLWDNGDQIVLDLTDEIPSGEDYTIRWRRDPGTSADPNIRVEESANGSSWTTASGSPFTFTTTSYFDQNITASTNTRYLRFTTLNVYNVDLDAVSYDLSCETEICNNGLDDDNDGLFDCDDPDCAAPSGISSNVTNATNCPGLNNGAITVTASGANLEFSINGGSTFQSSSSFTGLSAGTYDIRVRNSDTGCFTDGSQVTLTNDPISISIESTAEGCIGANNGTIDLTITGGSGSYSIDWDNDGTGDNDDAEDLSNLSAGIYSLTVTDANGCTATDTQIIHELNEDPYAAMLITGADASSFPSNTYSWGYSVEFPVGSDNYDCSFDNTYIPDGYELDADWAGNVRLSYTMNGGDANTASNAFQFNGDRTTEFHDFNPGNIENSSGRVYDVYGRGHFTFNSGSDPGGHSWTVTYDFTNMVNGYLPAGTVIGFVDIDGTALNGESVLLSAVLASGGSNAWLSNYDYNWPSNPHSTATYNAGANTYFFDGPSASNTAIAYMTTENLTSVTIDLTHGFSGGSYGFKFMAPIYPISSTVASTNATCGNSDGSITVTAGASNVQYSIDGGASYHSSNTFNNLPAGSYTVQILNNNTGCEEAVGTNPLVISGVGCPEDCTNGIDDDGDGLIDCADPDCSNSLTANAGSDSSICPGDSFNIAASASGGDGNYIYSWDNGLGSGANKTVTPATTSTYRVTVTDGNGCYDIDNVTITVLQPTVANASGDVTVCSGVSANINAVFSTGQLPLSYSWSHGLGTGGTKTVNPSVTTTYSVTVSGFSGCTSVDQVTVNVNETPSADAGADFTICDQETRIIGVNATGGTAPYTIIWDNGLGNGASHTISPTTSTTYNVTVTSANGCNATDQVAVTVQNCPEDCSNGIDDDFDGLTDCDDSDCGPTIDVGSGIFSVCIGGDITISATATGGGGSLTYSWSNGLGDGNNKTVSPASNTTYSVTVTAPSGCTDEATVTVNVSVCGEDCTDGVDNDGDGLVDCDDPDCTLTGAPSLADDTYSTCPGMPYSQRVTYNDGNLQDPYFSIFSNPTNGIVNIDQTGKFSYSPFGIDCAVDVFVYEVCNQTTGCCSQATVTISMEDNIPPTLTNVPADVTYSCDDALPDAPLVLAFDECPGVFVDFEETSTQTNSGDCANYTITRSWTARDFCGNETVETQTLTITDIIKPEIFQLYTLESGQKLVAGNAKNVTERWKYIPFPVTFSQMPIVFNQLITDNDNAAVAVRMRNISTQGFEMKISEEENADGVHQEETVSWLAIEPGDFIGDDFELEAGTFSNVNHQLDSLPFDLPFVQPPLFWSTVISNNDLDPIGIRHANITTSQVELFLQEETSSDSETDHANESVSFLAINQGASLTNGRGEVFGETGQVNLTNAWTTVSLSREYTKPVVIFGGMSNNDTDPALIRVRNVSGNSLEVRLQEWSYQDGNHGTETVSWMVVEGSIPGNVGYYCQGKANNLKPNINVFAIDNCDSQVSFGFNENESVIGGIAVNIRTWMAIDDCGNTNVVSRYDTCGVAAIQVKTILTGPVSISNPSAPAMMSDDLRMQELVPMDEPFSSLPSFPHVEDQTPDGEEDDDEDDDDEEEEEATITICYNHGQPDETTMEIPPVELAQYLAQGAVIGDCSEHQDPVSGSENATYQSIADGDWDSPSTWSGGNVPPMDPLDNETVSITHRVTVLDEKIVLTGGSHLWVIDGALIMNDEEFKVEDATAEFYNAELITNSKNVHVHDADAVLIVKNSVINSAKDVHYHEGMTRMENVCLTAAGNYHSGAIDTLINVTVTTGKEFKNQADGHMYLMNCNIKVQTNNFENEIDASLIGDHLIISVESGDIINDGSWDADISQYCVEGNVSGISSHLPETEECEGMEDYFTTGLCQNGVTSGGGNTTQNFQLITICHAPGSADQQTLVIPAEDLNMYLAKGDVIGSCDGTGNEIPVDASFADYRTIDHGDWNDPAVWSGGNVPPTDNINNKKISIEHQIEVSGGLEVKNWSTLWITHGGLTVLNGDFINNKSEIIAAYSTIQTDTLSKFQLSTGDASFVANDCVVSIGNKFVNNGGARCLDYVRLEVEKGYENNGGKDTLTNVCAVVNDYVSNNWFGKMHLEKAKFHLPTGSFWNLLFNTVTGDSIVIFTEAGSLANWGFWTADITQYCVADTMDIPFSYKPGQEDCLDIVEMFNPCDCYEDVEQGDGNFETEDQSAVNAGSGQLDPDLVDVDGDNAIVDWMLIELRDTTDHETILGYATAALQRDGDVVSETGESIITFPELPEGEYYVVVRHRNHLGIMTESPMYLSAEDAPLLDLTDESVPVMGGSDAGQILSNGSRSMWAGDFNEDNQVIYQGPNNDIFTLFSRVLSDADNEEYLANYIVLGYELADLNLDGQTIYQGPNNDRSTLLYHSVLSHPANSSFLANYIVKGMMP